MSACDTPCHSERQTVATSFSTGNFSARDIQSRGRHGKEPQMLLQTVEALLENLSSATDGASRHPGRFFEAATKEIEIS